MKDKEKCDVIEKLGGLDWGSERHLSGCDI